MRKFQIIPISHSLKGNKIAKSGEIVSESQLTSPASELIEAGFIKEVFEEEDVFEEIPVITLPNKDLGKALEELDTKKGEEELKEEEIIEEEIPTETTPAVIDKESISDIKSVNKK